MLKKLLALLLALSVTARAQLNISEFLASNSNSITDEDGNHSDWIEIQNTGVSTVNLAGWYLTDNSGQPREWAFPAWTLGPGKYLVVFASGKDRKPAQAVAGQDNSGAAGQTRLHTNFKLDNAGEYLALTKDLAGGGLVVAQSFDPFPTQATDVSYGTQISVSTTPLIASGASARTLIPTAGNGGSTLGYSAWTGGSEPFSDGAWTAGTTPVGFPNTGVATANLKLRLNANDGAAMVSDTSGAGHDGTNNGATWLDAVTDATGVTRHGALQFNATDSNGTATGDQVVVPGGSDFNGSAGTVMFWIKTAGNVADGGATEGSMLFDRRNSSNGLVIYLREAGNIQIQPESGGAQRNTFQSTGTVKDNLWHHVALVYSTASGAACTFYIDGVASGTSNNSGSWSFPSSQQIEIGRSHDTYWRRFNGWLDDYRFYNTALTLAQIQKIAANEDEPVTPGTNVQGTMLGTNASAFVRVPFFVTDPSAVSTLSLTMQWNDGYVAWINGTKVANFAAPATPLYNSLATQSHSAGAPFATVIPGASSLLHSGTNILAVQALNNGASNSAFSVLPKLDGVSTATGSSGYLVSPTPGASNSALKSDLGPFVSAVTKNPDPRPTGTAASPPLTITAKVLPSLRPLAASNPVQLKYLIMYGAEQTVTMTDLGATPGDPAGTHLYSASIPTNTLGAGQMLRWRVVATDNTGATGTGPEYSDPTDNEQYYGTVAVDSSVETNLPMLYWFASDGNAANNSSGTRNSFFFKAVGDSGVGRFYDNVEINLHGQSSSGFPRKSYDLDFNEDNRFEWNVAEKRVKDINLLTNWGDKSMSHNTMAHEAFGMAGSVHHWCMPVRVQQVTPSNAATPSSHFFSVADMMEDGDDDFLARNGLDPNGALYKVYDNLSGSGSAEKKTRKFEDKTDYDALVSGLNLGNSLAQRRQYAYDNMDLPQCVSYFVGCILVSHQDHGHKNFYLYRDSLGTKEWSILPWDVDLTWGRDWQDSAGYFTDTIFVDNHLDQYNSAMQNKGENRLYTLIVGNSDAGHLPATEFRDMVLRRLRTVMDGYLNAPNVLEDRFAQFAEAIDPPGIGTSDADRSYAKWSTWGSTGGYTAGGDILRYHLDQIRNVYLPGRRSFLATATLAGASVPGSQPLDAANLLSIQTVDFNPATGTQEDEFFVIRNANSYSVDISGWQITGAVKWTFKPGTVLPPGGGATEHLGDLYVAKNPAHFRTRTSVPDDGLPEASRYRFVQGPYSGQLSARGETIELRDANGTLLKTKTWTPAPTAAQNQLRITELNYAPAPPTAGESAALPGVVASDFEYVELTNIGATPLTLTGAYFSSGIAFTFPSFSLAAGARCLVVGNLAAFQLRYGHGYDALIAGVFEGNLDNNGEEIQLMDANGESILDFTYDSGWFPPSDEGGRTLVIRSATPNWSTYDLPQSWALSGSANGSPGAADTDFANVYEGWRWDFFASGEMPTSGQPNLPAALLQDPDGDGLNNLGEYAFGRQPKVADNAAPLTVPSLVGVSGANYLAVTFQRRHQALDLTYIVEVCGNLGNNSWTPVDLPVGGAVDLGNGVEQVTYRDNVAQAPGVTRFIRVRAVKP